MDDDFFYFGETLSGRTGLVPSNFVERIPDHVLLVGRWVMMIFKRRVLQQNASRVPSPCCSVSASGSLPRHTTVGGSTSTHCYGPIAASSSSTAAISQPCALTNGPRVSPLHMSTQPSPTSLNALHHLIQQQQQHVSPTAAISNALLANGAAPPPPPSAPTGFSALTATSRPVSPSFALNVPPHHAQITADFTDLDADTCLPDAVCPYPPVDVSKVSVQELRQPDKPRGELLRFVSRFDICQ